MAIRGRRRTALQQTTEAQLELRPLMNVIIVLIPMLLLSAVFMEIRVIDMAPSPQTVSAAQAAETKALDLRILVEGDAYVVEGQGVATQAVPREVVVGHGGAPTAACIARLTQVLQAIVAAHPDNREVRIVAQATTRYQEIVALMDLARAAGLPSAALEGARMEGV